MSIINGSSRFCSRKKQDWTGSNRPFSPGFFQPCFNIRLDRRQQVLTFQIGTGAVVRKITALGRPGLMHGTAPDHAVSGLKNAGTVILDLKGMLVLHVPFADFTVRDLKIPGQPVYIRGRNQKHRSLQPVATVSRTIITVEHGQSTLLHGPIISRPIARLGRKAATTNFAREWSNSVTKRLHAHSFDTRAGKPPWDSTIILCHIVLKSQKKAQNGHSVLIFPDFGLRIAILCIKASR